MGEHGSVHTQSTFERSEIPECLKSGNQLNGLTVHNIAELWRAMEEAEKWETRLNDSPLGKTQQDFVAYYTGVTVLFKEWCTANCVQFTE